MGLLLSDCKHLQGTKIVDDIFCNRNGGQGRSNPEPQQQTTMTTKHVPVTFCELTDWNWGDLVCLNGHLEKMKDWMQRDIRRNKWNFITCGSDNLLFFSLLICHTKNHLEKIPAEFSNSA